LAQLERAIAPVAALKTATLLPCGIHMNSTIYTKKRAAAKALSISPRTIDEWRARGILPFIKIGGVVLFDLDECRKVIEKRFKVNAAPAPKNNRR
jgi:hypothetical protein